MAGTGSAGCSLLQCGEMVLSEHVGLTNTNRLTGGVVNLPIGQKIDTQDENWPSSFSFPRGDMMSFQLLTRFIHMISSYRGTCR